MAAKSRRKKSTRQARTKKKPEPSFLKDEIVIWMTLAASILILLSIFGAGGIVGPYKCFRDNGVYRTVYAVWSCGISCIEQG